MVNVGAEDMETTALRLVWPQWQGAGEAVVAELLPGLALDEARRAYTVGTRVLEAILPDHDGPTEVVPVPDQPAPGTPAAVTSGMESRAQVVAGIRAAQAAVRRHTPARILTLGGECSVSVVPFTELAARYGTDLAVVWVDSHPDVGTTDSRYPGYHAMAVSQVVGRGDAEVTALLPATVDPSRVALAGLHAWTDDDYPHIAQWGLSSFTPDDLRTTSRPLLDWLAATGCSRVAVHLDVDTVDADEVQLGLGYDRGGLSLAQANRVVRDLAQDADVVALTVAEYVPRQVIALTHLLAGLPLSGTRA